MSSSARVVGFRKIVHSDSQVPQRVFGLWFLLLSCVDRFPICKRGRREPVGVSLSPLWPERQHPPGSCHPVAFGVLTAATACTQLISSSWTCVHMVPGRVSDASDEATDRSWPWGPGKCQRHMHACSRPMCRVTA